MSAPELVHVYGNPCLQQHLIAVNQVEVSGSHAEIKLQNCLHEPPIQFISLTPTSVLLNCPGRCGHQCHLNLGEFLWAARIDE